VDWATFLGRVSSSRRINQTKCQGECPVCAEEHGGKDVELNLVAQLVEGRINFVCFAGHDREDILAKLESVTPSPPRAVEVSDDTRNHHEPEKPAEPAARVSGSVPAAPRPNYPPASTRNPADEFSRRVPPHNLEAEQSVLGAVLLDNEALSIARRIIGARDFYREQHRTLFQAMCELADQGQPIDALTLRNYLRLHGKVDQIPASYVADLAAVVPTASSVRYYAQMVQESAVKRRIARDAGDLIEMAYNGVQAESLLGEWQRRVTVLDRGFMAPVEIPWEELGAAEQANAEYLERQPVVDKLCYSSAVSMITGGKHAGKSTLARWLAICVAKGIPFLRRNVMQGPVMYIASEDEEMAARSELIRLGWALSDDLRFFGKSKIRSDDFDFLGMLTKEIQRHHVVLVVIDMLFDFVRVDDEMSYSGTRRAVGHIQDVASDSGAHLCVLHHAPKNAQIGDAAVAALGSQGLAARVSPIILVRRFGPGVHSISSTTVRDPRGEAIPESRLIKNADNSIDLGGVWKGYMLAEVYVPRLLDIIDSEPDSEFTITELAEALGPTTGYAVTRQCLAMMFKQDLVGRRGSGRKGQPYRYCSRTNASQENSELETYMGDVSNPKPSQPTLINPDGGRYGYKETEYQNDLDQYGISKSK